MERGQGESQVSQVSQVEINYWHRDRDREREKERVEVEGRYAKSEGDRQSKREGDNNSEATM